MIVTTLASLLLLQLPAESNRAEQCAPKPGRGVHVSVDERFANVSLDRFMTIYFSEAFNDAAAPLMGIKKRELVGQSVTSDGTLRRRVRMQPAMIVPAPLRMFGTEDDLRYDEVSAYDASKHLMRFFIDSTACDQLRYGGTIAFLPDGDGVRLRINAVLQVDALFVGGIVEALVQGGVRDGYDKMQIFMQSYLDRLAEPSRGAALLSRRDAP